MDNSAEVSNLLLIIFKELLKNLHVALYFKILGCKISEHRYKIYT